MADIGFYTGIGSAVLTLLTCVPFVNWCTCFLAPLASIAAIVMGMMARSNLGPEASGQAADRARYALYLGIGSLVLLVLLSAVGLALGFGIGLLQGLQNGDIFSAF